MRLPTRDALLSGPSDTHGGNRRGRPAFKPDLAAIVRWNAANRAAAAAYEERLRFCERHDRSEAAADRAEDRARS